MLRTLADTALTLDAGARYLRHVGRVDGPHGAQPGAGAAAGAPGQVRLGLGFQELGGLAVRPLGHIVGRIRISRHRDRRRKFCQVLYLFSNPMGEVLHLPPVLPVRAAVRQSVGEGVAAGEGPSRQGVEAVRLQDRAQLRQGVVKAAVAKGHHSRGQGSVPLDVLPDKGQHLVGQLAGIGGHPEHHQIPWCKDQIGLPLRRACKAPPLQGNSQGRRQSVRDGVHCLVRVSCGAPVRRHDALHFHGAPPLLFKAGGPHREKSSSFRCPVSSAAGRGGTRLRGSYRKARQWCSAGTMPCFTQATSRSLICWPRWQ